jgi:PLP dependent protein
MSIKDQISGLQNIIARKSPDCKLIAVTKTKPLKDIMEAYDVGLKRFGENKVQELVEKYGQLPDDVEWHMIGHLQRNKVKYIVPFVHLIQSVDSERLLEEINKQGFKINRIIPCLLQVHIAEEESKFGFSEDELKDFLKSGKLSAFGNVFIKGLMGMATFTDDERQIRKEFRNLGRIFKDIKSFSNYNQLRMEELSMGMSSDFMIAIEEGSTMVRVGSAIFGERDYTKD